MAIVNRLQALPICQLEGCGKELDIHDWRPNDPLPKHCRCKHAGLDHRQDARYEAKHQRLLKHTVMILHEDSYRKYNDYVEEKYGKDYLGSVKKSGDRSK